MWPWYAYGAVRQLRRDGLCDILATGTDTMSMILGWLVKSRLGVRWIVNSWDHPYPRFAGGTSLVNAVGIRLRSLMDGPLARRSDLVVLNILPDVLRSWRIPAGRLLLERNGVLVSSLQDLAQVVVRARVRGEGGGQSKCNQLN